MAKLTEAEFNKQIKEKLKQISKLYDECEQLSNENNLEFYFDEPLKSASMAYYPTGYKSQPETTERWIEENWGDTIGGRWISSSDRCD